MVAHAKLNTIAYPNAESNTATNDYPDTHSYLDVYAYLNGHLHADFDRHAKSHRNGDHPARGRGVVRRTRFHSDHWRRCGTDLRHTDRDQYVYSGADFDADVHRDPITNSYRHDSTCGCRLLPDRQRQHATGLERGCGTDLYHTNRHSDRNRNGHLYADLNREHTHSHRDREHANGDGDGDVYARSDLHADARGLVRIRWGGGYQSGVQCVRFHADRWDDQWEFLCVEYGLGRAFVFGLHDEEFAMRVSAGSGRRRIG